MDTEEKNKPKQVSYPKKFYTWLLQELSDWQEEGLIQDSQAESLRQRYALEETSVAVSPTHTRLIRILTILGVLLIGAGIIIFFASNWQKMTNGLKLGAIFTSLIGSYFLGYYWRYERANYPTLGAALILLGAIIFGAGILLISQIYHLGGRLPSAFLAWSIGTLVMAWVSRLTPVLVLSSLLFSTWSILWVAEFQAVQYFYLIFIALTFLLAYLYRSRLVIVLNILGLTVWLCTTSIQWLPERYFYDDYLTLTIICLVFGILTYASGYLNHFSLKTIGLTFWYRFLGLLMILTTIYILTFKGAVTDFIYYFAHYPIKTMPDFLLGFTLVGILALIVVLCNILLRQGRTKSFRYEMLALVFMLLFIFFITIFPISITAESRHQLDSPVIVYYSIIFNLVFFAAIIGTILMGYFNAEVSFVYIGLVIFIINLITRYCEYAWAMMDRALFFIGGGIILLVGGFYLERLRRKLLQQIKRSSGSDTA